MNTPTFRRLSTAAALLLVTVAFTWAQIPSADLERMEQAAPARATARPEHPRKLLVFTLSQGYRHTAIERASAALQILAKKTGAFEVVFSADTTVFLPASLKQFDGICFNNTTWLSLADPVLRKSILDFVTNGGGIIGIHAGVDNFYSWPEGQEMFGGYFDGHPWTGDGTWAVTIEDPQHPLMTSFHGKDFRIHDELYRIAPVNLRKNCRVLMRIDSNDPHNRTATGMRPSDRDLPISWIRTYGKGRVFYCSLGHNDEIYWNPAVLQHYMDGLQYAFGDLPADATPRPFDPMIMLNADSLRVYLGQIAGYVEGTSRLPMMSFDALVRRAGNGPEVRTKIEQSILVTLQGQATSEGKRFLCQRLADFGTGTAVPVLAGMLEKPATFDIALYALEAIPGSASERVLVEALDRYTGDQRVAVVNAIGSRRVPAAVDGLQKLLSNSDPALASIAAASLGRCGTLPALEALKGARNTTTGAVRQSILEGMLRAAEFLATEGEKAAAVDVYRGLSMQDIPVPIRIAAVRALVQASEKDAPGILTTALAGKDEPAQTAVLEMVPVMSTGETVHTIAGKLPQFSDGGKIQLLSGLAKHPDPAILQIVSSALKDTSADVRIAAVRTLRAIGTAASVRPLAGLAATTQGVEQREARESLASLGAPGTDDTLTVLLASPSESIKSEAIRAMRERRVPSSVVPLVSMLKDRSPKVRQETALALRPIAEERDIPALMSTLLAEKADGPRRELENSIVAISLRIPEMDRRDAASLSAYAGAKSRENRMSLIRVLGKLGTRRALETVVPALKDRDKDVMLTAVRSLSEWPTPAAYNELWALASGTKDKTVRILAIRGAVRTTGLDTSITGEVATQRYRAALAQTTESDEKKQLLALIGGAPSKAAFDVAAGCLADPALHADAELTMLTCGESIFQHAGTSLSPDLEKLLTSSSESVRERAQWLLKRIKRLEEKQ